MKFKIVFILPIFAFLNSCFFSKKSNEINKYADDSNIVRDLSFLNKSEAIETLEINKSTLNQWRQKSLSSNKISNINYAKQLLTNVEHTDADVLLINKYLSEGSVWFFSFDNNFHCITLFDRFNSPITIIKW